MAKVEIKSVREQLEIIKRVIGDGRKNSLTGKTKNRKKLKEADLVDFDKE